MTQVGIASCAACACGVCVWLQHAAPLLFTLLACTSHTAHTPPANTYAAASSVCYLIRHPMRHRHATDISRLAVVMDAGNSGNCSKGAPSRQRPCTCTTPSEGGGVTARTARTHGRQPSPPDMPRPLVGGGHALGGGGGGKGAWNMGCCRQRWCRQEVYRELLHTLHTLHVAGREGCMRRRQWRRTLT